MVGRRERRPKALPRHQMLGGRLRSAPTAVRALLPVSRHVSAGTTAVCRVCSSVRWRRALQTTDTATPRADAVVCRARMEARECCAAFTRL